MTQFRATTIVAVHTPEGVAVAGDGQVTMGEHTIMKHTATKVRKLYHGQVLTGFAGSVADAFVLFDRFEHALEEASGQLEKAAIALAQGWRTDQALRKLDALLLAADKDTILLISGGGEVIAAEDGVAAIGSGGNFALSAAQALKKHTAMPAAQIAEEALRIAANICVYTNDHITVLTLEGDSDDRNV